MVVSVSIRPLTSVFTILVLLLLTLLRVWGLGYFQLALRPRIQMWATPLLDFAIRANIAFGGDWGLYLSRVLGVRDSFLK